MRFLGIFHLITALLAIGVGAVVLLVRPKGTRLHRQLGLVYVAAMLALNVSALGIYRLLGTFGPFHAAAIISLISVLLGWRNARQAKASRLARDKEARGRWVEGHYYWMTWSYVGLLAAFASEAITRHPAFHILLGGPAAFGLAVGVATLLVVGVGAVWIRRAHPASVAPFKLVPFRTSPEIAAAPNSAGT